MNFNDITWWQWLIAGVCIIVVLTSIRWYRKIPIGYEDENGFHYGADPKLKELEEKNALLEKQLACKENCIANAREKSNMIIEEIQGLISRNSLPIPQSEASEKLQQKIEALNGNTI